MHPKNILLSLLLLAGLVPLLAQSDRAGLEQRLAEYTRYTSAQQYDSVLQLIDPRLYELVPRSTLLAQFEQLHQDTNMVIRFGELHTEVTDRFTKLEGDEYGLIRYRGDMEMRMVSAGYREADFLDIMGGILAGQYGENNVTFDSTDYAYSVVIEKEMVAIRRGTAPAPSEGKQTLPWYFLEYRPEFREMMAGIIPPVVYERLKQ